VLKELLDTSIDVLLSSPEKDAFNVLSHLPHYFNDHDLVIAVAVRDPTQTHFIMKPLSQLQQLKSASTSVSYNTVVDRIRTVVNHRDSSNSSSLTRQMFSQRPAAVRDVSQDDIVVVSTGMAAIFSAFRIVLEAYKEQFMNEKTCQFVMFGFPYLDTLKLFMRPELNKGGCHFFGNGDDADLEKLEHLLQQNMLMDLGDYLSRNAASNHGRFQMPVFQNKISAIFAEFPTNPLMKCSQLQRYVRFLSFSERDPTN
jgi:cystathionine beta-lyase/cystathionine gamma-synthase